VRPGRRQPKTADEDITLPIDGLSPCVMMPGSGVKWPKVGKQTKGRPKQTTRRQISKPVPGEA